MSIERPTVRAGLFGYVCPTGLGYENRRMWSALPFDRWLVWSHGKLGTRGIGSYRKDPRVTKWDGTEAAFRFWLRGLDVLVCAERPGADGDFELARDAGVRTVLLVNAEWTRARLRYVQAADVLIARTEHAVEHLRSLRPPPPGRVVLARCPLILRELPFRRRRRAERFVYTDGWGGVAERKGWPVVRDAWARLPRNLQFQVYSQRRNRLPGRDPRRQIDGPVATPSALYAGADVAVQPSRFEGIGLSILEAMACGLPVMTTDAGPMREPVRAALGRGADRWLLPATPTPVNIWGPWTAHDVDARVLARRMVDINGADIAGDSAACRAFIEDVHGASAWRRLWSIIEGAV